jgi:hypothetical protein
MNDSREVRTLPDGYQVHVHPPDARHPEGKQVFVPGQSRLRERLLAAHPDHEDSQARLQEQHRRKVTWRRARLAAEPAVPPSKRCV